MELVAYLIVSWCEAVDFDIFFSDHGSSDDSSDEIRHTNHQLPRVNTEKPVITVKIKLIQVVYRQEIKKDHICAAIADRKLFQNYYAPTNLKNSRQVGGQQQVHVAESLEFQMIRQ